MNRRITQVAVAAAAAMALSLAAPVSAQAAESGAIAPSQNTVARSSAPSQMAPAALGTFAVRNGAIAYRGNNTIQGRIAPNVAGGSFQAEVRVNGVYKGLTNLYSGGIYYTGAWGAGAVRLGPVHYVDPAGAKQVAQEFSNPFRIRQAVKWNYSPIVKRGSKVTFKLKGFRTFTGTRWVSVKKVKLQVKKGKKWKTIKTVRVNANGHGKYSLKSKKKRPYRVYIPTTTRVQGAVSRATRI